MMGSIYLYAKNLVLNIIDSFWKAPLWAKIGKVAVGGWVILSGIHNYFYIMIALIAIDVVTGVWAALKSGEGFKSRVLRRGLIEKFCLYNLLILTTWFVERLIMGVLGYTKFYAVLIVSIFMATYEMSSIVENMVKINPDMPFLKRIARLLNILDDSVEKKASKIIETVGEEKIKELK